MTLLRTAPIPLLPDECVDEVLGAKYLGHDLAQIVPFDVIDRDADDAVFGEQISREFEPWVHHAQPVGVESPVGLRIGDESIPRIVDLSRLCKVLVGRLGEVVVIDEVITGVVRRIDVDELDLAEVGLLEQLECVEIVTFDEDVFRRVKVDGLPSHRAESLGDRRVRGEQCFALAGPVELVALLRPIYKVVGKFLSKQVKVDQSNRIPVFVVRFSDDSGKQFGNFINVPLR